MVVSVVQVINNMSNEIKITVQGSVNLSAYKDDVEITINGEFCNSGCQDLALLKHISVDTIVNTLDHDELLTHFKVSDLVDHIINVSGLTDDEIINISKTFLDSVK